jgi:branched-subunit amino acid ABC-type transport system permease component
MLDEQPGRMKLLESPLFSIGLLGFAFLLFRWARYMSPSMATLVVALAFVAIMVGGISSVIRIIKTREPK